MEGMGNTRNHSFSTRGELWGELEGDWRVNGGRFTMGGGNFTMEEGTLLWERSFMMEGIKHFNICTNIY